MKHFRSYVFLFLFLVLLAPAALAQTDSPVTDDTTIEDSTGATETDTSDEGDGEEEEETMSDEPCKGLRGTDQALCRLQNQIGHEPDCTDLSLRGNERAYCKIKGNKDRKEMNRSRGSRRTQDRANRFKRQGLVGRDMNFRRAARQQQQQFQSRVRAELQGNNVRARLRRQKINRPGRRGVTRDTLQREKDALQKSLGTVRGAGRKGRAELRKYRMQMRRQGDGSVQLQGSDAERLLNIQKKTRRYKGAGRASKKPGPRVHAPKKGPSRQTLMHLRERRAGTEERRSRLRDTGASYRTRTYDGQSHLLPRYGEGR